MSSANTAGERAGDDPRDCIHAIGEKSALPAGVGAEALGFKAWNLARMAALGLPVPPAFVLGTGWCSHPADLQTECWLPALRQLERVTGLEFGHSRRPLLLSVRSGAAVSMPGMLETILDVGLTDATLPGFVQLTGNPRLAWDAYRRLVAGYGEVVAGIDAACFDADLRTIAVDVEERELDFAGLRALTRLHLATYARETGRPFPQDPQVQLKAAIDAVFASWNSDKAEAYRAMHDLSPALGTAVTVQQMVFGNAGGTSGAGVGFTRNPSTGEPSPWVDFLFNAQGEDVVSGRRTARGHEELAAIAPAVWESVSDIAERLERAFSDMQDFEFTVQDGRLYLLQTRNGKRTAQAAARIALDLHEAGIISHETARERTAELDAKRLALRTVVAGDGKSATPLARATSAAAGVACGEIALSESHVRERHAAGIPLVLVRAHADTHDIGALALSEGLLTRHGARTAHAAVVARQLGKVCLVGCEALVIDEAERTIRIGTTELREGDLVTLDGNDGAIYGGETRVEERVPHDLVERLARLVAADA